MKLTLMMIFSDEEYSKIAMREFTYLAQYTLTMPGNYFTHKIF